MRALLGRNVIIIQTWSSLFADLQGCRPFFLPVPSKLVCQSFETGGTWKLANEIKKCHFHRGHAASLDDQARQSKKPCRVPLEMFLHSQGRPSLLINPSAPAPLRLSPSPDNKVIVFECCHLHLETSKVADISLWRPPNLSQDADCASYVFTAEIEHTQWAIKRRVEMNTCRGSLDLSDSNFLVDAMHWFSGVAKPRKTWYFITPADHLFEKSSYSWLPADFTCLLLCRSIPVSILQHWLGRNQAFLFQDWLS